MEINRHGTRYQYIIGCRCSDCKKANAFYMFVKNTIRQQNPIPAFVNHGTTGTYSNYGCRCAKCKAAWRVHMTDQRIRRHNLSEDKIPVEHGTSARYENYGCRCEACKKAESEYRKMMRYK